MRAFVFNDDSPATSATRSLTALPEMRNDRSYGDHNHNQGDPADHPHKTLQTAAGAGVANVAHFASLHGHACDKCRTSRLQDVRVSSGLYPRCRPKGLRCKLELRQQLATRCRRIVGASPLKWSSPPFARQSLCGRAGPTNAIWQYRRGVDVRRLLVGQQHGNLAVCARDNL